MEDMKIMNVYRAVKIQDNKYLIIDCLGNKRFTTDTKNLKERIGEGYLDVIDYKLDSRGRLVRKKVELKGLRKTYGCYPQTPLSWDEQVMILFYGLARLNQLSKKQKQKLWRYFESLHTIDEEDLKALIADNINWYISRYQYLDTACRDTIIDFLHKLLTNQLNFIKA